MRAHSRARSVESNAAEPSWVADLDSNRSSAGEDGATHRRPLAPAPVAPHPLLRSVADPCLELLLHMGHGPADVLGLIGRARHAQFLELDLEAARRADALDPRQPDARADAARDHGADGLRLGIFA